MNRHVLISGYNNYEELINLTCINLEYYRLFYVVLSTAGILNENDILISLDFDLIIDLHIRE